MTVILQLSTEYIVEIKTFMIKKGQKVLNVG